MAEDGKKYSELEGDERKQNLDYIRGRWNQLYSVSQETNKEAVKYVALVNAGGAVAMLAFLGTLYSASHPLTGSLLISLVFFVIGVALCGFSFGVEYRRVDRLFNNWRESVEEFYGDNTGFTRMVREDVARSEKPNDARLLLWSAWACFLAGCVSGFLSML